MRWLLGVAMAVVIAAGAAANQLELRGEMVQGGLAQGRVEAGSEVRFEGRRLRLDPEGRFVLGFGRDFDGPARLEVRRPDGRVELHRIEIERRRFVTQRIDGLPPRQVTPSDEDLVRIQADARRISAARSRDSDLGGFAENVAWPATGPISGVFGSQRILNGEPRAPHKGLDIAAPAGTRVGAMAEGLVSLASTGMYFTGGTVMVDHGHGLHSIYVHLQDVLVEEGQRLKQGESLGTVGATGRATGPHLHWGVYWFDEALDPALLVGPMPSG